MAVVVAESGLRAERSAAAVAVAVAADVMGMMTGLTSESLAERTQAKAARRDRMGLPRGETAGEWRWRRGGGETDKALLRIGDRERVRCECC